jgi:hypothetical protein
MSLDLKNLYPSEFLHGADLPANGWRVSVKEVTTADFDGGTKAVLKFKEDDRTLPLNKTQVLCLYDILGPNTDAWPGREIILLPEKIASGKFAGKITIRIDLPRSEPVAPGRPQPTPEPEMPPFDEDATPPAE